MDAMIPEPFRTALRTGNLQEVADHEAQAPEARYGRALVRLHVGRDGDARSDLESAAPVLGDVCLIEIVHLDLRDGAELLAVLDRGRQILARAPEGSSLEARCRHIVGLVESKLRRITDATASLVEAANMYRSLGDRPGWARVQDTLGTLHASQGRMDLAMSAYALSLVEKAICGDRYGTAITLGNLGRVHLRLGRYRDALDCFEINYRIASQLKDARGCARMLEDMGRAHLGLEDFDSAKSDLRLCLDVARRDGFRDLEFFARKDLVRVHTRTGQLEEAERQLELAAAVFPDGLEPYFRLLLDSVRGELFLSRGDDRALELLEDTAREFGEYKLPDYEISLLITLSRAYARRKLKDMAQFCLNRALEWARREGYERYLRPIRESIVELGNTDWRGMENGRLPGPDGAESFPDGYTVLECLGTGAFGVVYRAFDPLQDRVVALKRIQLDKIYDVKRRRDLLVSAKSELEAASGIRHPGVARVFALGQDTGGGIYVVQEYIKGDSLRSVMSRARLETREIIEKARLIANALDALHRDGVVHRDLKPENILLRNPDGSPVIVDFGVSSVAGFDGGFAASTIVGTLAYMAPEQLDAKPVDSKADMYSLGVILYEWIASTTRSQGQGPPISHEVDPTARQEAMVKELQAVPDLDARIIRVIGSLVDPDPSSRPTASRVAEICGTVADEESHDDLLALLSSTLGTTHDLHSTLYAD